MLGGEGAEPGMAPPLLLVWAAADETAIAAQISDAGARAHFT